MKEGRNKSNRDASGFLEDEITQRDWRVRVEIAAVAHFINVRRIAESVLQSASRLTLCTNPRWLAVRAEAGSAGHGLPWRGGWK